MKAIFYPVMLMLCLYSTTARAQQIDSILAQTTPGAGVGLAPTMQIAFDVYVSDTTNVDTIHIKLGYQPGGNNMFQGGFAVNGAAVLYNAASHAAYYHISVTNNPLVPRFVAGFLHKQDGTVSHTKYMQLYQ